jgi:hypothetical protein
MRETVSDQTAAKPLKKEEKEKEKITSAGTVGLQA